MRNITSDWIFPISSKPIKNGLVSVDESGEIIYVGEMDKTTDADLLEKYTGVICPGFVNTHCHLELSHLKERIPEKVGMTDFLFKVMLERERKEAEILSNIKDKEKEMIDNGIVAVVDIVNTDFTFAQKAKKNIYYYTFVEVFGFDPRLAYTRYTEGVELKWKFNEMKIGSGSLTPHATYSLSDDLFKMVMNDLPSTNNYTIHNQESWEEDEFFRTKSGGFTEFYDSLGIKTDHFTATGKSPLQSILRYFNREDKLLLVHNTFTNKEDIEFIKESDIDVWWSFCPKANLYITNKLPDFKIFKSEDDKITIGTDSLASNDTLSILEELKIIRREEKSIDFQNLLKWATLNGAKYLGVDEKFGSIVKGKHPGLNLIEDIDQDPVNLTQSSRVKVLC